MQKPNYSPEFKEQALIKVYSRKNRTIAEIALELNMRTGTLKSWMKAAKQNQQTPLPTAKRAQDWAPAERLLALNETHLLDQLALSSWCRERGLFAHQLTQWKDQFCRLNLGQSAAQSAQSTPSQQQLRTLKQQNQQLQSQLNRKDRALAEAAALLVLQKKFQALWEDEQS